jgi:hypothetical protein
MKNRTRTLVLLFLGLALATSSAMAQSGATSVFASGLLSPIKLISTPEGNLMVSESGNTANGGRVSLLTASGTRRTLIDGLPAAATAEGGFSGPTGLEVQGHTLYIIIGEGDTVLPGPAPGTLRANPSPTSPLFSAVLSVHFSSPIGETASGFTLTAADHALLKTGARLRLNNASGERATVEVVADIRDFTYEFNPNFADNVRNSNPFAAAIKGNILYVVNAGQNSIIEVDLTTGDSTTVFRFARRPNPLPFGAPFIDAVPDSIRVYGKLLLVPTLLGFPFPPGASQVRAINRTNFSERAFISGLTSAIDILPAIGAAGQEQFFVLEFSTNMLAPGTPGRLSRFDAPGGSPVVLAGNLITPTSLAQNPVTGDLFITQLATGQVIRVTVP